MLSFSAHFSSSSDGPRSIFRQSSHHSCGLPPLTVLGLSSDNPPILDVVSTSSDCLRSIFRQSSHLSCGLNLLVSLSQFLTVISRLSWVQPILIRLNYFPPRQALVPTSSHSVGLSFSFSPLSLCRLIFLYAG